MERGGTKKRIIPLFCSCTHVVHATRGSFSTIPYNVPIGGNLEIYFFIFSFGGRSLVVGQGQLPLRVFSGCPLSSHNVPSSFLIFL